MILNIPIYLGERKYKEFQGYRAKGTPVLFRTAKEGHDDILFVLAHGSKDGGILINGHLVDFECLYKALEYKGVFDKGIRKVSVICCYGAYQKNYYYNGIEVKAFIPSKQEIYINCLATIEGDYEFEIHVSDM